jgi:hypothetical protein
VGDRVIYEDADGARHTGYITTLTDSATGVLSTTRAGGTVCEDMTGATVVAICDNLAAATPGTVTIVNGVATFSETQNLAPDRCSFMTAPARSWRW